MKARVLATVVSWITGPNRIAVNAPDLWMSVGFNMIYFLAALQGVDRDCLEAADVDGANAWQKFLAVILPEIAPVTVLVVRLSLLGSLQFFELPFILLK